MVPLTMYIFSFTFANIMAEFFLPLWGNCSLSFSSLQSCPMVFNIKNKTVNRFLLDSLIVSVVSLEGVSVHGMTIEIYNV